MTERDVVLMALLSMAIIGWGMALTWYLIARRWRGLALDAVNAANTLSRINQQVLSAAQGTIDAANLLIADIEIVDGDQPNVH